MYASYYISFFRPECGILSFFLFNQGILPFYCFTVELILTFNCILEECGVYIKTPNTSAESYLVHGKLIILVSL